MRLLVIYRSIWWKKGTLHICTRNYDKTPRTIDDMLIVLKNWQFFRQASSSLHDWESQQGDHTCQKCGSWIPGYTTYAELPLRGCNNSRSLVLIGAPRLQ